MWPAFRHSLRALRTNRGALPQLSPLFYLAVTPPVFQSNYKYQQDHRKFQTDGRSLHPKEVETTRERSASARHPDNISV
jgi:hypothetical protein